MKACLLLVFLVTGGLSSVSAQPPAASLPNPTSSAQFLATGEKRGVTIVAERTEAGAKLPAPDPGRPVYAAVYDGGFIDFPKDIEWSVAGEKIPTAAALDPNVRGALAIRGIVPARSEDSPSIAIAYYWGARKIGSGAIRRNLLTRTVEERAENKRIIPDTGDMSIALDGLFFVVICAYDAADLQRGVISPLWRIKASTHTNGITMTDAIPTLLAAAGEYFGRAFASAQNIKAPVVELRGADALTVAPAPDQSSVAKTTMAGLIAWTRNILASQFDPGEEERAYVSPEVLKLAGLQPAAAMPNDAGGGGSRGNPAPAMETFSMLAVAENTDRGVAGPWPAAQKPVPYVAFEGGYVESGPGWPKPPPKETVAGSLRLSMNSIGFSPATADAPPAIGLIYYWGAMYSSGEFPTTRAQNALIRTTESARAEAERRGTTPVTDAASLSLGAGRISELYFVLVTAYDFKDLRDGKATPLWRLKLTARTPEADPMATALPSMMAAGFDFVGATPSTQRIRATVLRYVQGEKPAAMQIGEAPPIPLKALDEVRNKTRAWLQGKRDNSPDDEAFLAAKKNPPAIPLLPGGLTERISAYQEDKTALQNTITTALANQTDPRARRDAFKTLLEENASRVAALEQTRKKLRDDLMQLRASNPGYRTSKTLDDLINDFAGDVQQLMPR